MHSNKGTLRIVGGKYRSRRIRVPARPGLRPTPDRVRETLFNWLGQDLSGLACLDLYAGSGALGFEAASLAELERNRAALGAAQVVIAGGDAQAYLARGDERFDVVFLDPPFRQNAVPAILEKLPSRLEPGGRVYVESDTPVEAPPRWTEIKRGKAGQVSYQLLQWDASEAQP